MRIYKSIATSFSIFLLAILAGCGVGPSNQTGVCGTISNAEGETVYLERFTNKKLVKTDSAKVDASGNFSIIPAPALELDYYRILLSSGGTLMILTDSSECLKITADGSDLNATASVSGSVNTGQLIELSQSLAPMRASVITEKTNLKDRSKSTEELSQSKSNITEAKKQMKVATLDFIKKYPGSPATLTALSELNLKTDIGFYEKVLDETSSEFSHSFYYQIIKQQTQNAKQKANVASQQNQRSQNKYSVGMEAPDLVMNDPDGNQLKLSDLRGKVVLLDFWASWCGPCRRENPHVVHSYEKYNKEGFEVFSVSLDRSVDPWKKAIAQDGLLWPYHVSDLKGWQSDASALYGVHSIPSAMLLDRDGKIIGNNMRSAVLTNKLKEIFGH